MVFRCRVDETDVGVLWAGDTVLPHVRETLTFLRNQKKQVIFVTNNSMKSRHAYVQKFIKLGIQASEEEIFGSSYASAIYIARVLKLPKEKKVYILGERGVEEELEAENVPYFGGTNPDDRKDVTEEDYEKIKPDESVGAVLCGLDQHISYKKLAKAFTYLRQGPDVHFIATNTDSTYPTHGTFFPGAGTTTTAALEYATKRKATVCGKPSQTMLDAIFAKYHLNRERTCMVGDRLNTDIEFGIQGGLGGTLLVLTGVSSLDDCEKEGIYPQYVTDGFGDFAILDR
jgi:4-nitrophenyl phosphatase